MPTRPVAALLLFAAAAALAGCARKTPDPVPTRPADVVVDYPIARTITDYEDFTGRTEPVQAVELKARVTGYLENVYFKDGQDITAGKPLFDLDRRVYKAEYDKATAALTKAERHLKTMESNYQRAKFAHDRGSLAREAFDVAAGDLAEAEADVAFAAASLELADTNLKFTRVSAPFDGRLGKRLVDPGNLVKADETPLVTLVALDPLYAAFDVDERTVSRFRELIRKGEMTSSREEPRAVRIGTAADDESFPLSGLITFTDNQFDAGTGTLRVRATVRNPKLDRPPWYMLSPGQFIRVRLPVGNPRPALLVPESALGSDQGRRFVFLVNDRNEVERRDVRLGPQFGTLRVIEGDPLKPTDRVIVEGLLRVRPGAKVNPKPADPGRYPSPDVPFLDAAPAPAERTK
jgi:multidrug efflux system membrane fusion protein